MKVKYYIVVPIISWTAAIFVLFHYILHNIHEDSDDFSSDSSSKVTRDGDYGTAQLAVETDIDVTRPVNINRDRDVAMSLEHSMDLNSNMDNVKESYIPDGIESIVGDGISADQSTNFQTLHDAQGEKDEILISANSAKNDAKDRQDTVESTRESTSRSVGDTPIKEHQEVSDRAMIKSREKYRKLNQYKRRIFIDWPLDSDNLSYLNYKSLESLLSCCYGSSTYIETIILGHHTINYYKVANVFRYDSIYLV